MLFGYFKGEFVGHMVSKEGHHAVPRLVEKIRNAKIPNTKKELLRFLGLANFYREHVPRFAGGRSFISFDKRVSRMDLE